ncbi:MAG: efflux RND transporter periplasmic adaptor subunit [Hyphomicrobium sp.]
MRTSPITRVLGSGLLGTIIWAVAATGSNPVVAGDTRQDGDAIPIRGVVRAVDQAAFSTDLGARVLSVHFREGERFKAGQPLIEFDCRKPRAEAASAEAVHREMQLTLDSNKHLEKHQAIGRHDVEISKARVAKAAAEADALKARLDQCIVIAPFDGRVAVLGVQAHEVPGPGKPFLSIVGADRLEIELIVPSSWLTWLKTGDAFTFAIDETGRSYPMTLSRLAATVDPVSQMIKVIAVKTRDADEILPGMSGSAFFKPANG